MLSQEVLSTLTNVTPDKMSVGTYYYIISPNRLGASVSNSVHKFYTGKFMGRIVTKNLVRYLFCEFGEFVHHSFMVDDRTVVRIKLEQTDRIFIVEQSLSL